MINHCRSQRRTELAAHKVIEQVLDTAADGMRVVDKYYKILHCNKTFAELAGLPEHLAAGKKCYEVFSGPTCHTSECPLVRILGGEGRLTYEAMKKNPEGREVHCQINAAPFLDAEGNLLGIVESFRDISEPRARERERERLIGELARALREVKTLTGLLPICAWCKQIRDDSGYWSQLEKYITTHSSAQFSHSICPECMKKEFPEYEDEAGAVEEEKA
jgi:PAS domain S-box-containing protein